MAPNSNYCNCPSCISRNFRSREGPSPLRAKNKHFPTRPHNHRITFSRHQTSQTPQTPNSSGTTTYQTMETRTAGGPNARPATEKGHPVPISPTNLTSGIQNLSFPSSFDKATQFPFLLLPGEIRNKIYSWTFILSRSRDEMYDIPDFVVHGDSKSTSAIRWNNVERYNLLLVCKQTFLESLPVISRESYMEIKIYTDDILRKRDRKSNAAYAALMRTKALCQDARKVVLNITPQDFDVDFYGDEQLPRLAALLAGYPKLKDLTLRVRPVCILQDDWSKFHGFFELCKKGVSLCFELLDYEAASEDEEEAEEIEEEHKATELMIETMAEDLAGEGADVWMEWNLAPDDREYY